MPVTSRISRVKSKIPAKTILPKASALEFKGEAFKNFRNPVDATEMSDISNNVTPETGNSPTSVVGNVKKGDQVGVRSKEKVKKASVDESPREKEEKRHEEEEGNEEENGSEGSECSNESEGSEGSECSDDSDGPVADDSSVSGSDDGEDEDEESEDSNTSTSASTPCSTKTQYKPKPEPKPIQQQPIIVTAAPISQPTTTAAPIPQRPIFRSETPGIGLSHRPSSFFSSFSKPTLPFIPTAVNKPQLIPNSNLTVTATKEQLKQKTNSIRSPKRIKPAAIAMARSMVRKLHEAQRAEQFGSGQPKNTLKITVSPNGTNSIINGNSLGKVFPQVAARPKIPIGVLKMEQKLVNTIIQTKPKTLVTNKRALSTVKESGEDTIMGEEFPLTGRARKKMMKKHVNKAVSVAPSARSIFQAVPELVDDYMDRSPSFQEKCVKFQNDQGKLQSIGAEGMEFQEMVKQEMQTISSDMQCIIATVNAIATDVRHLKRKAILVDESKENSPALRDVKRSRASSVFETGRNIPASRSVVEGYKTLVRAGTPYPTAVSDNSRQKKKTLGRVKRPSGAMEGEMPRFSLGKGKNNIGSERKEGEGALDGLALGKYGIPGLRETIEEEEGEEGIEKEESGSNESENGCESENKSGASDKFSSSTKFTAPTKTPCRPVVSTTIARRVTFAHNEDPDAPENETRTPRKPMPRPPTPHSGKGNTKKHAPEDLDTDIEDRSGEYPRGNTVGKILGGIEDDRQSVAISEARSVPINEQWEEIEFVEHIDKGWHNLRNPTSHNSYRPARRTSDGIIPPVCNFDSINNCPSEEEDSDKPPFVIPAVEYGNKNDSEESIPEIPDIVDSPGKWPLRKSRAQTPAPESLVNTQADPGVTPGRLSPCPLPPVPHTTPYHGGFAMKTLMSHDAMNNLNDRLMVERRGEVSPASTGGPVRKPKTPGTRTERVITRSVGKGSQNVIKGVPMIQEPESPVKTRIMGKSSETKARGEGSVMRERGGRRGGSGQR